MKAKEQPADDPQARVRQLVARYMANGQDALRRMDGAELLLLLSAKQLHLGMVAGRCEQGEGLHVNVPLKRILEGQVNEIGKAVKDIEMER